MKISIRYVLGQAGRYSLHVLKWLALSIITGFVIGGVSTVFSYCLSHVTSLRSEYSWIVYGLPFGGIIIVGLYKLLKNEGDKGTNLVIESIDDGAVVPIRMAPSIFISTVITHLFGGSAGREGAALQIGGSLGSGLARLFRLDEKDKKVIIMSGMSAAFSALFGTPMAASIFSIEISSVGMMNYSALLPCIVAALVASEFSATLGISPESFPINGIPNLTVLTAGKAVIVAALCALVSIMFCYSMKYMGKGLSTVFKNKYVKIAVCAVVFLIITTLIGGTDFYGAGIDVIERAVVEGEAKPYAFIVKLLLTSLIIEAGFKGGEIVPSFYVGATFGCVIGHLIGLSPSLCAAVGMTALFCGVTNCPITSILISFELFGFDCAPYILIAVAISFVASGYTGIYSAQKINYSKIKPYLRPKN